MAAPDSVQDCDCDCETTLLQLRLASCGTSAACCMVRSTVHPPFGAYISTGGCLLHSSVDLLLFISAATPAERARRPIMVRVSSVRSDRSVGRSPHHKHLSASWMGLAKEAVTFITACPPARRRPLLRGDAYWVVEAPATAGCGFTWMVTPLVSPLTISGCDASA